MKEVYKRNIVCLQLNEAFSNKVRANETDSSSPGDQTTVGNLVIYDVKGPEPASMKITALVYEWIIYIIRLFY